MFRLPHANRLIDFFLKFHETEINLRGHMHKYAHVPTIKNLWSKYGEPILYCNGETDQITQI